MIDERTPNLSLPLPHPENLLTEDVARLRQALSGIDGELASVGAQVAGAVQSVDAALAAQQSSVNAALASMLDDSTTSTTRTWSSNKISAALANSKIPTYAYGDRASLRSLTPADGAQVIVEGLGLFVFYAGSDEPDDDESCFATSTGRWLLEAVHWDVVDAWQHPNDDYRDAWIEDEPLRFVAQFDGIFPSRFASSFASSFASRVLNGTATCAITSVAATSSASFTGTVTGAAVGDHVIATPPGQLGSDAANTSRLAYHAWVSAANTVTVMLTNASAAAATTNSAIQTAWPITVIKNI